MLAAVRAFKDLDFLLIIFFILVRRHKAKNSADESDNCLCGCALYSNSANISCPSSFFVHEKQGCGSLVLLRGTITNSVGTVAGFPPSDRVDDAMAL